MFRETLPFAKAAEFVEWACRRIRPASLAVQMEDGWRHCSTRRLPGGAELTSIRALYPTPLGGPRTLDLREGQQAGVKLLALDRHVMFMSRIVKIGQCYRKDQPIPIIELAVPAEVVCVNKRRFFRVTIPKEKPLPIRLWDTSMRNSLNEAEAPRIFIGSVLDLSIGGGQVGRLDGVPDWDVGTHIGLRMEPMDFGSILLIAEVRRCLDKGEQGRSYGLSFIGAETLQKTIAAQDKLANVVNRYQRWLLENRVASVPRVGSA